MFGSPKNNNNNGRALHNNAEAMTPTDIVNIFMILEIVVTTLIAIIVGVKKYRETHNIVDALIAAEPRLDEIDDIIDGRPHDHDGDRNKDK